MRRPLLGIVFCYLAGTVAGVRLAGPDFPAGVVVLCPLRLYAKGCANPVSLSLSHSAFREQHCSKSAFLLFFQFSLGSTA